MSKRGGMKFVERVFGPKEERPAQAQKPKIMVIDDDARKLDTVKKILSPDAFEVITVLSDRHARPNANYDFVVENADAFEQVMQAQMPALVLSDCGLSGLSIQGVVEKAKAQEPAIPVVGHTSMQVSNLKSMLDEYGYTDVPLFSKMGDFRHIENAIRDKLNLPELPQKGFFR